MHIAIIKLKLLLNVCTQCILQTSKGARNINLKCELTASFDAILATQ